MAEFVEVIERYKGMCYSHENCMNCPMQESSIKDCRDKLLLHPERVEETVMNWDPMEEESNG